MGEHSYFIIYFQNPLENRYSNQNVCCNRFYFEKVTYTISVWIIKLKEEKKNKEKNAFHRFNYSCTIVYTRLQTQAGQIRRGTENKKYFIFGFYIASAFSVSSGIFSFDKNPYANRA